MLAKPLTDYTADEQAELAELHNAAHAYAYETMGETLDDAERFACWLTWEFEGDWAYGLSLSLRPSYNRWVMVESYNDQCVPFASLKYGQRFTTGDDLVCRKLGGRAYEIRYPDGEVSVPIDETQSNRPCYLLGTNNTEGI